MSKSLGNGIDPLEIIDKYGTDALRFALTIGTSPGNDLRFSEEKAESSRNFANKIWNASRFVLMNFDDNLDFQRLIQINLLLRQVDIKPGKQSDREVTENMEKFELGIALQKIYEFIWKSSATGILSL